MKILHISHHAGCIEDIKQVCATLGYDLETQHPNWSYNVDAGLATQIWETHKDYYNSFDCIITSDTAPLCRIFLQNNYNGKLIIWVCNRFDYADQGPHNIHHFPDPAYYELFKEAAALCHFDPGKGERTAGSGEISCSVKIFSYTKFEHEYALEKYGFTWNPDNDPNKIIRPCCQVKNINWFIRGDKAGFFFIPPYHNDGFDKQHHFKLDGKTLQEHCKDLDITTYQGRYNGIQDLTFINGIIHIPYAWSNLALFENWAIGNPYLIPSKEFLLELSSKSNFFWSPPFLKEYITSSEWYLPEHEHLFLYFDDWAHLQWLTRHPQLIAEKSKTVKEFAAQHQAKTLAQWKQAIELW